MLDCEQTERGIGSAEREEDLTVIKCDCDLGDYNFLVVNNFMFVNEKEQG